MPSLPAVSCLMPTFGRDTWLPAAVDGFLAQTFRDAELLIVSEDGLPAALARALASGRVRHLPCPAGLPLGTKRNLACEAARGQVLLHWDDDDLQAPDRIDRQHAALCKGDAAIHGSRVVLFREMATGRCWEYRYAGADHWVCGATLAYKREYWRRHPFDARNIGEDNAFVWAAQAGEVLASHETTLCLCSIHARNTSPRNTSGDWWREIDLPAYWRARVEEVPRWRDQTLVDRLASEDADGVREP
jgi:O-antigen biosynthesis protein